MANALHATLSSRQRRRLRELRYDPTLKPRERDRVEALLLSADGMRVPCLARHFDCCQATVRRWLHQFATEGLKSLRHQRRGLGPDVARRQAVRRVLNGLLSQKRTWTAAQLAVALAAKGLPMKPRTVRKYLTRYVRTTYVLRHRQDPEAAAAARVELDDLKKKPLPTNCGSSSSTKAASP
jgi:transposase